MCVWRAAVVSGLVAALPASATDLALPGQYQVARIDVTVPGAGGSFVGTLFYPTVGDFQVDPSGGQYPGIVFGHGFLQEVNKYTSTLQHLASHGYFVLAPNSQTGLFPNHTQYAIDYSSSLSYLEALDAATGSTFFGRLNNDALGVAGHSLGGGTSFVVAALDSRVKAAMGLAPSNTNTSPPAQQLISSVTAPVRILVGSDDLIASYQFSSLPLYENAQDPRQIQVIQGGGHLGFQDSGFIIDDTFNLSRPEHLAISRRELTTFFDFYLKRDESLWREVWGPGFFDTPRIINQQLDPGIALSLLSANQTGLPGQATTFQVTLTNTGGTATQYDLFLDDQSWSTQASVPTTPVLSPGQSYSFEVIATPPPGRFNAQDRVLLSARSGEDGLTRAYTFLTTSTPDGTELAAASLAGGAIQRLDTAGNAGLLAGANAGLLTPIDVKFDPQGNIVVADLFQRRVVRIDAAGAPTVIAGLAQGVSTPSALAFDPAGNLYVSDYLQDTILKITPQGAVTLFADAAKGLDSPFGMAVDAAGNLYVANLGNAKVLRIDADGNVTVFADAGDGLVTPMDVKFDAAGNLFVADLFGVAVRRFTPAGVGSLFADVSDGLTSPSGLLVDHRGYVFVSNYLANRILQFDSSGTGALFADASDGLASPVGLAETTATLPAGSFSRGLSVAAVPEASSLVLGLFAGGALAALAMRGRSNGRRTILERRPDAAGSPPFLFDESRIRR